jgi:CRISPR-associated protein (TIGR02710 family)
MNHKKILIITVGGSDEPIVNAIKDLRDEIEFIYFICSGGKGKTASSPTIDGEGKVIEVKKEIKCPHCEKIIQQEERRECILKQSGYKGKYKKIEIENPDNFKEVYEKTSLAISEAKKQGKEIICDFTGGTKTMSSVLAMLSVLDFETTPFLTIGIRRDIIKTMGVSHPEALDVDSARTDFVLKIVDELISKYLYFPASLILKRLLHYGFKWEIKENMRKKLALCEIFYMWDSFNYEEALENLKNYGNEYQQYINYLLKLLDRTKNSGYEKVFDLISNAERQACNGFYDNAVARIYRAVELFAQIRLKKEYDIDTSSLQNSLDKIKNKDKWLSKRNDKGEIKIGLKDAYELLEELEDPVGSIYKNEKNKFIDILNLRNFSKLAHGDIPVDKKKWDDFFDYCKGFIERCCREIKIPIEYISLPDKF